MDKIWQLQADGTRHCDVTKHSVLQLAAGEPDKVRSLAPRGRGPLLDFMAGERVVVGDLVAAAKTIIAENEALRAGNEALRAGNEALRAGNGAPKSPSAE